MHDCSDTVLVEEARDDFAARGFNVLDCLLGRPGDGDVDRGLEGLFSLYRGLVPCLAISNWG